MVVGFYDNSPGAVCPALVSVVLEVLTCWGRVLRVIRTAK